MNDNAPNTTGFGDLAGEHLRMRRGKYGAWPHVVIAFIQIVAIVGFVVMMIAALIVEPPGGVPLIADRAMRYRVIFSIGAGGVLLGLAVAGWMFRDRWRCIEAFVSRYCSGILMLTMIYAPYIALVYACVRATRKLNGAERSPLEQPR